MNKTSELEDLEELEALPEMPPQKKSRRLPPLLRLTRRATVFLALTLIATILFFLTGNQQTFLDSNLSLILKIIACTAIALSFFSAIACLECIFYTIKSKKFKLILHFICYIITFAFSITISIFSLTINLLSEGVSF